MGKKNYIMPLFSVNSYDEDGDIIEEGIFLYFGNNTRIKVAENIEGYRLFVDFLASITGEIAKAGNYR